MNIEKTYELIRNSVPQDTLIDSLAVVKQVEQYRQLWKPEKTNVVLLAESHVYTNDQDFKMECKKSVLSIFIPNYPIRYVRFVYCLGYGENELLNQRIKNNFGTPQYWKIFSSCIAENEHALGFQKILKRGDPSLLRRLRNKIDVLQNMQEKGIWLLDASIVGLYQSGITDSKTIKEIIEICWENYIASIIKESEPKHIIVIGKGVERIIGCKLNELSIPRTTLPQPQGVRENSQEQLENYKKYQRICAKYR